MKAVGESVQEPLRYESGQIGENPNGISNNLIPYITQVAVGKLTELKVYGDPSNDETCIRN